MNNTKWCNGFSISSRQSFAKETFSYDEHLKSYNVQYWKLEVHKRKKTAVHGTLVLLKTLIPTMNTLKDMAILNVIKTDRKWAPEAKRAVINLKVFFSVIFNFNELWIFFKKDILKHVDKIVP